MEEQFTLKIGIIEEVFIMPDVFANYEKNNSAQKNYSSKNLYSGFTIVMFGENEWQNIMQYSHSISEKKIPQCSSMGRCKKTAV